VNITKQQKTENTEKKTENTEKKTENVKENKMNTLPGNEPRPSSSSLHSVS
jgi:hypothetical protein